MDNSTSHTNFFFVLLILRCYVFDVGIAIDTITSSKSIKDHETLRSKDGKFTLGFFSPQNSTNRYVGIWWMSQSTVVWVPNRNQPLNDSSGKVTISEDGNLVVLNGQKHIIWSSNMSNISPNTSSEFSDFGKLVLMETLTGNILWDSFQQPSNTLLPGMKLSTNIRTGMKVELTSWKSPFNPSIGSYSSNIVHRINRIELLIWTGTRPYWRSGPWNGRLFRGIANMETVYLAGFQGEEDGEGNSNIYYTVPISSDEYAIYVLNSKGQYEETRWDDEKKDTEVSWTSRISDCDVYSICGSFAICDAQRSPICNCLKGFEPRIKEEWDRQNWSSGCVRSTGLQCERVKDQNTSLETKEDGFLELQMVKVPDFPEISPHKPDKCRSQCLENCSCVAYSHGDGIGCMSWTDSLLDIQQFSSDGLDLYVRVAYTELKHDKAKKTTIIITITVIIVTILIVTCAYVMWRTYNHPARKRNNKATLLFKNDETSKHPSQKVIEELSQVKPQELLQLDFEMIAEATNNFHLSNKLGQGGFGSVYKGELLDGQDIAVKRLSRISGQGLEEFMNEVVVILKLQHRNLVRLFGCCVEGDENMLIYEYMPNKSLDMFIFDPSKSKVLD